MLRRAVTLAAAVALVGLAAPGGARADEPVAPAAAVAAPAAADAQAPEAQDVTKRKRKRARHKRRAREAAAQVGGVALGAELRASVSAGALHGEGTVRVSAPVTIVAAAATPFAERGRFRLELPIEAEHRQAIGSDLDETRGAGDLTLRWRRGPSLRLAGELGVRSVYRPDWPDQYQPLPDGALAPADRFSHFDRRAGVTVAAIPWHHQHVRVSYLYTLVDQKQDPSFEAVVEPGHLTPGDRDEHHLDASWRWYDEGWNAGVGVEAARTAYFFQFARDAGTGATHASPGGPPPNPLYVQQVVEPEVMGGIELADGDLEIGLGYGYEIAADVFQGYYSYRGHHPSGKLTWKVAGLELGARVDVKLRTYGPGSYAEGPMHPPLAYGNRRVDRRGTFGLSARYPLDSWIALVADASLTVRRTNFPTYVPGMFPATRQYDIDWNYDNWAMTAGVEVRR